jgi:hypothetical protein
MEYIDLETEVEIRLESGHLDMLQVGYLNLHMHRIINEIAVTMVSDRGWLTLDPLPADASEELILVRGITISVENGSFVQKIRLRVAAVFSGKNLKEFGRDLALQVAAGLVVAGGTAVIQSESPQPPPERPSVTQPAPDVNKMVRDLASNGGGRVTYRTYEKGNVGTEVILEIPNHEQ